MMCFNLRPGDRIRVGSAVVAFLGKEAGRSRFEVDTCAGRHTHMAGAACRVEITGVEASFLVEKRSGRSTRIALKAESSVAVSRLPTLVLA